MKTLSFLLVVLILSSCNKPEPTALDTRLVMYPNPATTVAWIGVREQSKPWALKAYDSWGNLMLETTSSSQQTEFMLDLREEGTYTAVLTIDGKDIRQSIIRP